MFEPALRGLFQQSTQIERLPRHFVEPRAIQTCSPRLWEVERNLELIQHGVKMSTSTYREVQAGRGKTTRGTRAFGHDKPPRNSVTVLR